MQHCMSYYSSYLLLLILETNNCQSHQYSFLLILQLLVIQKVPRALLLLASLPTIQFLHTASNQKLDGEKAWE